MKIHKTKAPHHPGQVHAMHVSKGSLKRKTIDNQRDSSFRWNDGGAFWCLKYTFSYS
ncbi:MAG: hypothetical protein AAF228_01545 [Pseudomonadota bacterium]